MPFLVALGLALVLTPIARRVGLGVGLVDRPSGDGLKIHARPVPVAGGVAVLGAALAAAAVAGSLRTEIAIAAGLALVAGLVDDARPLPASARLAAQGTAGAVLLAGPLRLDPLGSLGAAALVVLVVALTNTVNLIDGQDGLAGGLGGIAALGLAALAARGGGRFGTDLGLALGGALAGFLVWNRPPARIFLGNGGAYGVGALLAVLAAEASAGWRDLLAAGACVGVFAFELGFTVARRAGTGARIERGDRLHSYDLVAARMGRERSSLVFCALGSVAVLVALVVRAVPLAAAAGLTATGAAVALVAGVAVWRSHTAATTQKETT